MKKKHLLSNNEAVAMVIESAIAFSIVLILLSFFFISATNLYKIFDRPDVDLKDKSLTVCEQLISSTGQDIRDTKNWDEQPEEINNFGLATSPLLAYGTFSLDDQGHVQWLSHYTPPSITSMGTGTSCFLAGTKVLMGDGSTKNIENIAVGDTVLSLDKFTGRTVLRKVIHVFHHTPQEMPAYYLVINNYLRVTPNHLLYQNGRWTTFGSLTIGDTINNIRVFSVEKMFHQVFTFNLEIEHDHSYFVQLLNTSLIVHNDDQVTIPDIDLRSWVLASKIPYPLDIREPYGGGYYVDYTNVSYLGEKTFLYEAKGKTQLSNPILDSQKIQNLPYVPYLVARSAFGFDTQQDVIYNFNITIRNETDIVIRYGASYEDASSIASVTRDVLIYYAPRAVTISDIVPPHYEQGQITVRFFLGGLPPIDRPCRPSPANGSVEVSIFTDLCWVGSGFGSFLNYDIYLGTTSPPSIRVGTHQIGTCCNPPEDLIPGTAYYWQVIQNNNDGTQTDGPIWHFTTAPNHPPNTPANPAPADTENSVATTTNLSWDGGDPDTIDTVTYDVYFGTINPPPKIVNNQTEIVYNPAGDLSYGTLYYWQIVAWDNHGASTIGPLWTFTTMPEPNYSPNMPSDPFPPDDANDQSTSVVLQWTGGDPNSGDTVTYDVYFGTDNPPPKRVSNQSEPTYNPGLLGMLTTYYWQIIAWDNHGNSTAGSIWSFTTVPNSPPYTPANPTPADGATEVRILTLLGWKGGDPDTGDTVTYDIYFGIDINPPLATTIGPCPANQFDLQWDPGTLEHSTIYYWKIIATDSHGGSITGPIWHFKTGTNLPPNRPRTPTPSDRAINIDVFGVTLKWYGGDPNTDDNVSYTIYFGANPDPPFYRTIGPYPASPLLQITYPLGIILQYNTVYFWKISAVDIPGGWTVDGPIWSFKTKAPP